MLMTTIGLDARESKCLYLGKLIAFQVIKNEIPFLHYSKYMKKDLLKNTQSRDTAILLQQPIMLVPKHITSLTQ